MGVLDFLTGGKSGEATDAMRRAQEMFANVRSPSAADLTLPELQKYVQAGVLTPAQAQAVLNKQNAYDTTTVPTEGRNAQIAALNQLQDIASAKGMDPTAQAQTQQTLNALNTNMQGQRGAILDSFAQRGVPLSLASEAMQNQVLGQDAQAANANALQANADAQMRALQALQGSANVGANVQGQDWNQANTKAAAANAINQWNSQVANTVAENNAARQQQANAYNTGVKQDISNQNVGQGNYRTEYNAKVPQQVFSNAMQKAGGQASTYQNMAQNATQQGNQMMGLIGTGAGVIGSIYGGPAGGIAAKGAVDAMANQDQPKPMAKGGIVPGHAKNPGDNPANDTVPVRLSPGELVVPRSIVRDFVSNLPKKNGSAHPDDIKSVLKALSELRDKEIESDDGAWTGGCTKGMAAGGIVKDDEPQLSFGDAFKPSKLNVPPLNVPTLRGDLTAGSSTQNPSQINDLLDRNIPNIAEKPQIPAQMPLNSANLAPKPSVAAAVAPQGAETDTGMADYLKGLKSNVGEYGPDRQKAVADYLMQRQAGLGSKFGNVMSGIGDSLMMVAGKGNPGFSERYANKQQRELENAIKSEKEFAEGKMGQVESGMKIDAMDPNSPISKQLQDTYRDLLVTKLKTPANAVDRMPASEIKGLVASVNEQQGKAAENAIKLYEAQGNLGLRQSAIDAGIAEKGRESSGEALKTLSGMPWYSRAIHPEITQRLKERADLVEAPKPGPLGQTTVRNGITYEWSPISGKYHPKG